MKSAGRVIAGLAMTEPQLGEPPFGGETVATRSLIILTL